MFRLLCPAQTRDSKQGEYQFFSANADKSSQWQRIWEVTVLEMVSIYHISDWRTGATVPSTFHTFVKLHSAVQHFVTANRLKKININITRQSQESKLGGTICVDQQICLSHCISQQSGKTTSRKQHVCEVSTERQLGKEVRGFREPIETQVTSNQIFLPKSFFFFFAKQKKVNSNKFQLQITMQHFDSIKGKEFSFVACSLCGSYSLKLSR